MVMGELCFDRIRDHNPGLWVTLHSPLLSRVTSDPMSFWGPWSQTIFQFMHSVLVLPSRPKGAIGSEPLKCVIPGLLCFFPHSCCGYITTTCWGVISVGSFERWSMRGVWGVQQGMPQHWWSMDMHEQPYQLKYWNVSHLVLNRHCSELTPRTHPMTRNFQMVITWHFEPHPLGTPWRQGPDELLGTCELSPPFWWLQVSPRHTGWIPPGSFSGQPEAETESWFPASQTLPDMAQPSSKVFW